MTNQANSPTADESLMAAIAHFFGFLVALIVWVSQKDKSHFVRFQSIQAMAFDLVASLVMLIIAGLIVVMVFGVVALGVGDLAILGSRGNPTAEPVRTVLALLTAVPLLIPCIIIPVIGVTFLARLVAAIQTFQGKNFYYPWLGKWVERLLQNPHP